MYNARAAEPTVFIIMEDVKYEYTAVHIITHNSTKAWDRLMECQNNREFNDTSYYLQVYEPYPDTGDLRWTATYWPTEADQTAFTRFVATGEHQASRQPYSEQ